MRRQRSVEMSDPLTSQVAAALQSDRNLTGEPWRFLAYLHRWNPGPWADHAGLWWDVEQRPHLVRLSGFDLYWALRRHRDRLDSGERADVHLIYASRGPGGAIQPVHVGGFRVGQHEPGLVESFLNPVLIDPARLAESFDRARALFDDPAPEVPSRTTTTSTILDQEMP